MKDKFIGTNFKYKTFQNIELKILEDEINQYLDDNGCVIISQSLSSVCIEDADGAITVIYTASVYVEKVKEPEE